MTTPNRLTVFLLLPAISAVALTVNISLSMLWGNNAFVHEPLHSTMEALGAMAAIVMSIFLLQGKSEQDIEKYSPLAIGFLGMGILDGFHALSSTGNAFIFFHSMASLVGGFGSALIWLPKFVSYAKIKRRMPWLFSAGLVTAGVCIERYQEFLPAMAQNNVFSSAAAFINLAAGILFLVAAFYFVLDFSRSHKVESYLFSCLYLLFGVAEMGFPFSAAWNAGWWFWHLERLAAYFVVLYFLFHTVHRISLQREHLIMQLHDAFAEVNQLSGLLPICASCKKIRDDKGRWKQIESFITEHSEAEFSHGLCPDCTRKAYDELDQFKSQ